LNAADDRINNVYESQSRQASAGDGYFWHIIEDQTVAILPPTARRRSLNAARGGARATEDGSASARSAPHFVVVVERSRARPESLQA
jgi:hypothetical protein